jgi:aerotolerance regulator-like protein/VWA domain-containing protein/CARDB protein
MSFLAPLFFAGLAAIAVPILVHLIQRERKEVVYFPSLMFLRQIPYQSVERRRIHNWFLLLLRVGAMALVIAAFSRPFFKQDPLRAAVQSTGAREVVILLDRSASMGYGEHWTRAKEEARKIVATLGPVDKGTLVLFDRRVEEAVRATSDRGQLEAGIGLAKVSSDATRYAPALRWAQSKLNQSTLPRKEAILISDFQKSGWERQEDIRLPDGATLMPVSVAEAETSDLAITSVALPRQSFATEERVTLTVGVTNHGSERHVAVPVKFEINGRVVETKPVTLEPNASASVTFPAFTIAEANMQGAVHAGTDKLSANNNFYFMLSPSRPVSMLVIQGEGGITSPCGPDCASYFLITALAMNKTPPVKSDVLAVSRVTAQSLEKRSVVVLNDVTGLPTELDGLLKRFVEQGGGLFIILKDRTPWTGGESPILPGKLGNPVDRLTGNDATLGFLDYSHPIFEVFKDARSGNFSAARFLRYRSLVPAPTDRILARFDDGAAALVERRVGSGRVIAFTTPVDGSWSEFPIHPMFLPLVTRTSQYLAQYQEPEAWYTVGRVLDVSAPIAAVVREGAAGDTTSPVHKASGVVMTPGGQQLAFGEAGTSSIELAEQGFYMVRMQGATGRPYAVAVNLEPAESVLTPLVPAEFVKSATGHAAVTATGQDLEHPDLTPADIERKQSLWWFLFLGGALALLTEAVLSNRLSKRFGIGLLQVKAR